MKRIRKTIKACMAVAPRVKHGPGSLSSESEAAWNRDKLDSDSSSPMVSGICDTPRSDPAVHLTLVVDASQSMQGRPLAAVAAGVRRLLSLLQPTDVLTIWKFDSGVARPIHCEAQSFGGQISNRLRAATNSDEGAPWLFDAVIAAVEDLEAQGDRPGVVKPLIVLADYHESYGPAEAWEAKNALLWCQISNLHPILVSFGDPDLFEEVKQTKTREVFVESTSDEDLHKAFQVAGEFVLTSLKRAAEVL